MPRRLRSTIAPAHRLDPVLEPEQPVPPASFRAADAIVPYPDAQDVASVLSSTSTTVAWACLATFVNASATA